LICGIDLFNEIEIRALGFGVFSIASHGDVTPGRFSSIAALSSPQSINHRSKSATVRD